ncbi:MAG TPA: gliding motility-associated C-terminal domain-containing protein, partial [Chitinophagales bacterium]|nr:gliding motility-associated C-terminal domain-containing protein [Chitinophagales bacterium]
LAATTSGTYSVTVTDANGCTGTDSFDLVAIDCSTCTPPNAPIVSGNLTVCAGEVNTTAFTATAAAGMVINWYNAPTGGTLLGTGADYVPATPGTYYAQTATLADPTCVSTFTPATLQSDLVSVTLTANPTATATGGTVQLTATAASTLGTITSYVWTTSGPDALSCTDCPNPQVSVSQTTLFTVTAQDSFGCSATASVQVVVLPQGNVVLIPNAFSPNGDGVNDLFRVSGVNVESMELFIYNRWGVEMFAASGAPNLAWDGTYKGTDQEIGVYVYYANITFTNGETETYKGNVTLIR